MALADRDIRPYLSGGFFLPLGERHLSVTGRAVFGLTLDTLTAPQTFGATIVVCVWCEQGFDL
jgi:hypothetical protein